MSLVVFKTAPDRDCYVLFQTVNDCPVFIGDRAKTAVRLCIEAETAVAEAAVAGKLDRADQTGTSYSDGEGGWGAEGVMVGEYMFPSDVGSRFLPRANLEEFVRAAAVGDVERMVELSVEMEESGSVGGGV
ncbi:hypothetical protein [Nonomuraea basaltis]|uniref:hypothetical protein n=1 Tax=Nonomuraea basaltis TaxID=2495887 RepID=UPI00110C60FB|nr:hypothetical protein [Nonomuraea basaltis]TMR88604.1 hypothetical protein EJK15_65260 [Nonomuraea basaltis]